MEKRILYTTSHDDIIESISNISGCSVTDITNYLEYSQPFRNTFVGDIKFDKFFKNIGIQFSGNNQLYEIIRFDSCVISHLTTRISQPDKSDIYNLSRVLSEPTDISKFLASKGLIFKKTARELITYYNNELVNWNSFDSPITSRIKVKLRTSDKYMDNCINGFLFNHLIWEDSNVEHIKDCPEIITDICHVLHRQDIVNEWENISKSYALGFLADVKDIILDNYTQCSMIKSKIYLIYKYVIYYLIQMYHGVWNPKFDNPIIRLKDNCSVGKDNIIGFYEIE